MYGQHGDAEVRWWWLGPAADRLPPLID